MEKVKLTSGTLCLHAIWHLSTGHGFTTLAEWGNFWKPKRSSTRHV